MNEQALPPSGPTYWSRVAHTPLGDVLRGRLTGSLDLKAAIAAAALPQPLADLTRSVARRTRLWRVEQIDVARELAEHFRDGLAAGRTAEELIRSFGDVRQAARLIRRSRLRCRPLTWRLWRRGAQALAIVAAPLAAYYLFLAVWLFAHAPTLAHNYQLELIKPTSQVPEADRAWPFYRQALLELTPEPVIVENGGQSAEAASPQASPEPSGEKPAGVANSKGADANAANPQPPPGASLMPVDVENGKPGGKDWPKVVAWLEQNRAAVEAVRKGAARPRLGFFYSDPADRDWLASIHLNPEMIDPNQNEMVIALATPQLNGLSQLGRLLVADARQAAASGDRQAFVDDISALVGMAEQLAHDLPLLNVELTAYSLFESALKVVDDALAGHPDLLEDSDFAHLAHVIAGYAGGGQIVPDLAGERVSMHDFLQRIYSDDGSGGGRLTYQGLKMLEGFWFELGQPTPNQLAAGYLLAPLASGTLSRQEVTKLADAIYDRAQAEFQLPLWQWKADSYEDELRRKFQNPLDRIGYASLFILMSSDSYVYGRAQELTMERDATLVALALVLYHRRHSAWPEWLDQLVPDLLPAVPPDRFTGQPLRYRLNPTGPLLYSVGPDRHDDGGHQMESFIHIRPGAPAYEAATGWDWLLWRADAERP